MASSDGAFDCVFFLLSMCVCAFSRFETFSNHRIEDRRGKEKQNKQKMVVCVS